jgi:hypothetical protein
MLRHLSCQAKPTPPLPLREIRMIIEEFQSDPEVSRGMHHPFVCCTSRIDRLFSHPHIRASLLTVAIFRVGFRQCKISALRMHTLKI